MKTCVPRIEDDELDTDALSRLVQGEWTRDNANKFSCSRRLPRADRFLEYTITKTSSNQYRASLRLKNQKTDGEFLKYTQRCEFDQPQDALERLIEVCQFAIEDIMGTLDPCEI